MIDQFQLVVSNCSESWAEVHLENCVDMKVLSMTGNLTGPYSKFSRTLPATFPFCTDTEFYSVGFMEPDNWSGNTIVIDPCYWTPALPFLYELRFNLQLVDGRKIEQITKIGLKRWEHEGKNFRLERKRVVLRGAGCDCPTTAIIQQARIAEVALIIDRFDQDIYEAADQLGVILVVDLRNSSDSVFQDFTQLDWYTSVFLVLLSAEQIALQKNFSNRPQNCYLAQCFTACSTPDELADFDTEALAIELAPGEHPPAWLANIDRPVIAIQRGIANNDMKRSRAACDRLQAELAPEFDLAGYFVTP